MANDVMTVTPQPATSTKVDAAVASSNSHDRPEMSDAAFPVAAEFLLAQLISLPDELELTGKVPPGVNP